MYMHQSIFSPVYFLPDSTDALKIKETLFVWYQFLPHTFVIQTFKCSLIFLFLYLLTKDTNCSYFSLHLIALNLFVFSFIFFPVLALH